MSRSDLRKFFAAGCQDVWSHSLLIRMLDQMTTKASGFTFVDMSAGRGVYDVRESRWRQTGLRMVRNYDKAYKATQNIYRATSDPYKLPHSHELTPWLQELKYFAWGKGGRAQRRLTHYPGAFAMAQRRMRPQDRALLVEHMKDDVDTLRRLANNDPRVDIRQAQAHQVLQSLFPLRTPNSLFYWDMGPLPTFQDVERMGDLVQETLAVVPNARMLITYPIFENRPFGLIRKVMKSGLRNIVHADVRFEDTNHFPYFEAPVFPVDPSTLELTSESTVGHMYRPHLSEKLNASLDQRRQFEIDQLRPSDLAKVHVDIHELCAERDEEFEAPSDSAPSSEAGATGGDELAGTGSAEGNDDARFAQLDEGKPEEGPHDALDRIIKLTEESDGEEMFEARDEDFYHGKEDVPVLFGLEATIRDLIRQQSPEAQRASLAEMRDPRPEGTATGPKQAGPIQLPAEEGALPDLTDAPTLVKDVRTDPSRNHPLASYWHDGVEYGHSGTDTLSAHRGGFYYMPFPDYTPLFRQSVQAGGDKTMGAQKGSADDVEWAGQQSLDRFRQAEAERRGQRVMSGAGETDATTTATTAGEEKGGGVLVVSDRSRYNTAVADARTHLHSMLAAQHDAIFQSSSSSSAAAQPGQSGGLVRGEWSEMSGVAGGGGSSEGQVNSSHLRVDGQPVPEGSSAASAQDAGVPSIMRKVSRQLYFGAGQMAVVDPKARSPAHFLIRATGVNQFPYRHRKHGLLPSLIPRAMVRTVQLNLQSGMTLNVARQGLFHELVEAEEVGCDHMATHGMMATPQLASDTEAYRESLVNFLTMSDPRQYENFAQAYNAWVNFRADSTLAARNGPFIQLMAEATASGSQQAQDLIRQHFSNYLRRNYVFNPEVYEPEEIMTLEGPIIKSPVPPNFLGGRGDPPDPSMVAENGVCMEGEEEFESTLVLDDADPRIQNRVEQVAQDALLAMNPEQVLERHLGAPGAIMRGAGVNAANLSAQLEVLQPPGHADKPECAFSQDDMVRFIRQDYFNDHELPERVGRHPVEATLDVLQHQLREEIYAVRQYIKAQREGKESVAPSVNPELESKLEALLKTRGPLDAREGADGQHGRPVGSHLDQFSLEDGAQEAAQEPDHGGWGADWDEALESQARALLLSQPKYAALCADPAFQEDMRLRHWFSTPEGELLRHSTVGAVPGHVLGAERPQEDPEQQMERDPYGLDRGVRFLGTPGLQQAMSHYDMDAVTAVHITPKDVVDPLAPHLTAQYWAHEAQRAMAAHQHDTLGTPSDGPAHHASREAQSARDAFQQQLDQLVEAASQAMRQAALQAEAQLLEVPQDLSDSAGAAVTGQYDGSQEVADHPLAPWELSPAFLGFSTGMDRVAPVWDASSSGDEWAGAMAAYAQPHAGTLRSHRQWRLDVAQLAAQETDRDVKTADRWDRVIGSADLTDPLAGQVPLPPPVVEMGAFFEAPRFAPESQDSMDHGLLPGGRPFSADMSVSCGGEWLPLNERVELPETTTLHDMLEMGPGVPNGLYDSIQGAWEEVFDRDAEQMHMGALGDPDEEEEFSGGLSRDDAYDDDVPESMLPDLPNLPRVRVMLAAAGKKVPLDPMAGESPVDLQERLINDTLDKISYNRAQVASAMYQLAQEDEKPGTMAGGENKSRYSGGGGAGAGAGAGDDGSASSSDPHRYVRRLLKLLEERHGVRGKHLLQPGEAAQLDGLHSLQMQRLRQSRRRQSLYEVGGASALDPLLGPLGNNMGHHDPVEEYESELGYTPGPVRAVAAYSTAAELNSFISDQKDYMRMSFPTFLSAAADKHPAPHPMETQDPRPSGGLDPKLEEDGVVERGVSSVEDLSALLDRTMQPRGLLNDQVEMDEVLAFLGPETASLDANEFRQRVDKICFYLRHRGQLDSMTEGQPALQHALDMTEVALRSYAVTCDREAEEDVFYNDYESRGPAPVGMRYGDRPEGVPGRAALSPVEQDVRAVVRAMVRGRGSDGLSDQHKETLSQLPGDAHYEDSYRALTARLRAHLAEREDIRRRRLDPKPSQVLAHMQAMEREGEVLGATLDDGGLAERNLTGGAQHPLDDQPAGEQDTFMVSTVNGLPDPEVLGHYGLGAILINPSGDMASELLQFVSTYKKVLDTREPPYSCPPRVSHLREQWWQQHLDRDYGWGHDYTRALVHGPMPEEKLETVLDERLEGLQAAALNELSHRYHFEQISDEGNLEAVLEASLRRGPRVAGEYGAWQRGPYLKGAQTAPHVPQGAPTPPTSDPRYGPAWTPPPGTSRYGRDGLADQQHQADWYHQYYQRMARSGFARDPQRSVRADAERGGDLSQMHRANLEEEQELRDALITGVHE